MKSKKSFTLVFALLILQSACQNNSTPVPATADTSQNANCKDSASFVSDVTVPDGSHFNKDETFTKTWRIKNTGTCIWNGNYKLVFSSGESLKAEKPVALTETQPNATTDISVDLQAPAGDGAFTSNFQIHDPANKAIPVDTGTELWVKITVGDVTAFPTVAPFSELASCDFSLNSDFTNQLFTMVNNTRVSNGLPALSLNTDLSAAAQAHSADMACNSLLSHYGSGGSTLESRLAAVGYRASFQVENIYAQPPNFGGNPKAAVDWWMADAEHRDAILDSRVTEIGVGYAFVQTSELGGYFTIDLAAP